MNKITDMSFCMDSFCNGISRTPRVLARVRNQAPAALLLSGFILCQIGGWYSLWAGLVVALLGIFLPGRALKWGWVSGGIIATLLYLGAVPDPGPLPRGRYRAVVIEEPRFRTPGGVELLLQMQKVSDLSDEAIPETFTSLCRAPFLPWKNLSSVMMRSVITIRARFLPFPKSINPFAYESGLHRRGIQARCQIEAASPPLNGNPPTASLLRQQLDSIARKILGNGDDGALVRSMTFGMRDVLSVEHEQVFKRTALAHLLIVSGYQVTFLSGVLFFLVRFARFNIPSFPRVTLARCAELIILLLGAYLYVQVTGGDAACLRAFLALGFVQLARIFERGRGLLQPLVVSYLLVSALYPGAIFDPGVELTYAALIGLTLGSSYDARSLWRKSLNACLCATALTSAVSALWFGNFSLVGFFLNPIVAPIVSVIGCGGGMLALLLVWCGMDPSGFVLQLVSSFLNGCEIFLEWVVGIPYAAISLEPWEAGLLSMALITAVLAFAFRQYQEFLNSSGIQ